MTWNKYELSDLKEIILCLGGNVLATILKVLAEDYQCWSSGLPDLLLWNPNKSNK